MIGRIAPIDLYGPVNALAPDYAAFRVSERLLLTGHSHQAWPDVGFDAQAQAWRDAAEYVDEKWPRAFEKCDRVRRGFGALLGDSPADAGVGAHVGAGDPSGAHVALASNTHELVIRFLSALPLANRPRLVTTDGEFHSIRRQLDRLDEEGWVEVVKVPAYPAWQTAERLAEAVDDRTAAVLVSAVLFERGEIVPGLDRVAEACARHGAELLVDAYHALGAIPYELAPMGLEGAYVVGGGYKYLQLGEGNCFLRIPEGSALRPIVTGWFSEFGALADGPASRGGASVGESGVGESTDGDLGALVRYGAGDARFAGSTFDPTSQYRGAAVMDFFVERGLTPDLLREVSEHQVGLLAATFRRLDLDPAVVAIDDTTRMEDRAGFLALVAPDAGGLSAALRERGVLTDARGSSLRFGPAPYLTDVQLVQAMEALGETVR